MNTVSPARGAAATREKAHGVVRRQRGWLVPLGRAGYAAKGVVYLLVGVLAAQAAAGRGGDTTDTEGALLHILQAPSGTLLLAVVAVGLVGYAAWSLLAAAFDVEHAGDTATGALARIGYGVTGVIYAGLALTALGLALGTQPQVPNGDQAAQDRTAWLLSQPFGPWLVGAVGLIVIGVGLVHLADAARGQFDAAWRLSGRARDVALQAARAGYAAHGIALGLIGTFLLVAAIQSRPDQARGLGGSLATLVDQPFGPFLLGLLGLGLAAYGAFMLVEARLRRMVIS